MAKNDELRHFVIKTCTYACLCTLSRLCVRYCGCSKVSPEEARRFGFEIALRKPPIDFPRVSVIDAKRNHEVEISRLRSRPCTVESPVVMVIRCRSSGRECELFSAGSSYPIKSRNKSLWRARAKPRSPNGEERDRRLPTKRDKKNRGECVKVRRGKEPARSLEIASRARAQA